MINIFDYAIYRGWFGIDANIQTSLCEYGMLIRERITDIQAITVRKWFDFAHPQTYSLDTLTKKEIDNFFKENAWTDKKEVYKYADIKDDSEWMKMYYVNKLDLLLDYYGPQNIIGDMYYYDDEMSLLNCLNIADNQPAKTQVPQILNGGEKYDIGYVYADTGTYVAIITHTIDSDGDFWYAHTAAMSKYLYYAVGHSGEEALNNLKEVIEILEEDDKGA